MIYSQYENTEFIRQFVQKEFIIYHFSFQNYNWHHVCYASVFYRDLTVSFIFTLFSSFSIFRIFKESLLAIVVLVPLESKCSFNIRGIFYS